MDYKLTVLVSLYKSGKFIKHFLKQIKKQTIFSEIEWYFIDANSPDNEYELLLEEQKKHKNIRIKKTMQRVSLYRAWNLGIKKARADLISNLNVDDVVSDDYYETMVNEMEKRKDVDVIYSDLIAFKEPNQTFQEATESGVNFITPKFCDLVSIFYFGAPHNCPVWKASIHKEKGIYYDESFESAGDKDFFIRCNLSGLKFKKINKKIAGYYANPNGISTDEHGRSELSHEEETIIQKSYGKFLKKYGL